VDAVRGGEYSGAGGGLRWRKRVVRVFFEKL